MQCNAMCMLLLAWINIVADVVTEMFYRVAWMSLVRYVVFALASFPDAHESVATFLQNVALFDELRKHLVELKAARFFVSALQCGSEKANTKMIQVLSTIVSYSDSCKQASRLLQDLVGAELITTLVPFLSSPAETIVIATVRLIALCADGTPRPTAERSEAPR